MCACVCVCVCAHARAHAPVYKSACAHVRIAHVCMRPRVFVRVRVRVRVCACARACILGGGPDHGAGGALCCPCQEQGLFSVKRDLFTRIKRPIKCQKRPIYMGNEAY